MDLPISVEKFVNVNLMDILKFVPVMNDFSDFFSFFCFFRRGDSGTNDLSGEHHMISIFKLFVNPVLKV